MQLSVLIAGKVATGMWPGPAVSRQANIVGTPTRLRALRGAYDRAGVENFLREGREAHPERSKTSYRKNFPPITKWGRAAWARTHTSTSRLSSGGASNMNRTGAGERQILDQLAGGATCKSSKPRKRRRVDRPVRRSILGIEPQIDTLMLTGNSADN